MKRSKKASRKIRAIARNIIIVLVVLFVSIVFISCSNTDAEAEAEAETISIPEPTNEPEMINRLDYWKEHPEECPFERIEKTNALAKVADAVCPNDSSNECKAAVMACVWNRAHTNGFPNSIIDVANQPNQWQGMTSLSTASRETIKLAEKLLAEWESGEIYNLPIPRNSVYLKLSTDGIWFRSEWNGINETFVEYR